MEKMQARTDQLSAIFSALADPTRRAILNRLAEGEATVGELAAPFDLSLPAVSKHLKVLQRAQLVEQGRQAQWRPCRLKAEPLREVAAWLGRYQSFMGAGYDRLDEYLRELQGDDGDGTQQHDGEEHHGGRPAAG